MYDDKGSPAASAGVAAAAKRNPNKHPKLNDAPEGPTSHKLGMTGDSGMSGTAEVKTSRGTFHFK